MDFVLLEVNDEFNRPTWQDLFQPLRLTAFNQPKVLDKFIERWTRTIRDINHANLIILGSTPPEG